METGQRILTTTAVAAATMGLVLAAFWPIMLAADEETAAPTAASGTVATNGIEFSAVPQAQSYAQGQAPVIVLTARNTGSAAAEARLVISGQGRQLPDPRSRAMPMPTRVFSMQQSVSLAGGETRTILVPVDAKVPAGSTVTVRLAAGDKSAAGGEFSIPAAAPQTQPVAE
jgi:hypothetical protein